MPVTHSASRDVGRVAVLVPLRSFWTGKARLSAVLDRAGRSALIELMAGRVVDAAHDLDVLIVHDSFEVERWAAERGAAALRPTQPGLNRAVTSGRTHLASLGYDQVIIAHADLPYATDLRVMLTGDPVTIVTDRVGDGTNVLCIPTGLDFEFAYGPGSFDHHCSTARALGFEPQVIDDPGLAWDVDHPDDLTDELTSELKG